MGEAFDVFFNATEAFGNLLIEKMDFVGLEATMWFWILFAVGVWVNNARAWLRRQRVERLRRMVRQQAEHEKAQYGESSDVTKED